MHKSDLEALERKLGHPKGGLEFIAKRAPTYYHPFHLKTSKKVRHIDSPGKRSYLRETQKSIYKKLLVPEIQRLPACMVGSIKGRKLFDHITPHAGKETVICMDLENCFPNISYRRVYNVWKYDFEYSEDLAVLLTQLTTFRGYLPQGPPTSPLLCNFVLAKMAGELSELCNAQNITYTQYVDDVCMSGDCKATRKMMNEVYRLSGATGQSIKTIKTEIMDSKHQQKSTGSILNTYPRLPKGYSHAIVHEIKTLSAKGKITAAEKIRIANKIMYLEKFSKKEASRLTLIFNDALKDLQNLTVGSVKKKNARPCWHYLKNRYNQKRCPYL